MKKVIIIGATSGIGKGLAERFLREGNTVGITGRREDKLQEICSQNKNCFYSVSDVTKDTKTRSHTDGFQRNNAKCLDEKGISRFVPHSSI